MYEELVKRLRVYGLTNGSSLGRHMGIMDEAADAIEELLGTADALNTYTDLLESQLPKWISVEERLPENGEEVVTLGPKGGMDCGHFAGLCDIRKNKWDWRQHTVKTVIWWMPRAALPNPPKEDADEGE